MTEKYNIKKLSDCNKSYLGFFRLEFFRLERNYYK